MTDIRIGQGIDAHRFSDDAERSLVLAGVTIPEGPALDGHSDADVVLHALTDALLGAGGLGDLGSRFGTSELRYQSAPSSIFVVHALAWLAEGGWGPVNADITVIAQRPRLAPYRAAMTAAVAELLGDAQVSIKATTTDGMGFIGRDEGIAALAVVLLSRR